MAQNYIPDLSSKVLVISVTGADASKFLQGQLSCDVNALQLGQSTLGAYCNIKGKVEALFNLERGDSGYYLQLPADLISATLKELQKYAVFSKVKLDIIEQQPASIDEQGQILAKIPAVYAATSGLFFPHDLNLPQLGAVSFTKGCFRGQEIIARMQHRGNLKRRLHGFSVNIDTAVNPGALIISNNHGNQTEAGTVVRTCRNTNGNTIGLAVISDTILDQQLYVDTAPIKIV